MNTMFYTKILGGVCGSFLVLLLLKWGASAYYMPEAGHGEGEVEEAAYAIEVEDDGMAEEVVVIPFAEILAAASPDAGQRTFRSKCASCHTIEPGVNAIGPALFGVVDRVQSSTDFAAYSGALTSEAGVWTVDELNLFLTKPKAYAPSTTMGFGGFKKETDRANVIAYLSSL